MPSVESPPQETTTWAETCRKSLLFISRPTSKTWFWVILLILYCGFLFFYGIWVGEFWRTESLRAIIAAEFLRSGNWIVPNLYGEPLFTKPPGMYAAIALCSWPWGQVTEWSARLPSAIGATITVFLFFWYFSRQLGRTGGFLAALILPLSPLWLEKASSAEIDMLQVTWTAAAILFFLRALEEEESASQENKAAWVWWILSLICVAGGFLTKWTTPVFFYLTAISLLWWRGQLRLLWGTRHSSAALLAAGICLIWAISAIAMEGWTVFAGTIQQEAMQRLVPSYSPYPYPWFEAVFHPAKLILATLPFSVFALMALAPSFYRLWDDREKRFLQGLHCWVWPSMLFFCFPTEHATRHSFPLFPGLSGLAALVFFALMNKNWSWRTRWFDPMRFLTGTIILWVILKIGYVHLVVPKRTWDRQPQAKGELLSQLVPAREILYIFRIKDEGIMFYYGRTVRRLKSPEQLPTGQGPVYCILLRSELEQWQSFTDLRILRNMTDEQGDPMILVRVNKT